MSELGTCDHCGCYANLCDECAAKFSESTRTAGSVPRYATQGRALSEQDTLRVMVLAIKHMSKEHHDWPELMKYVERFDASAKA